MVVAFTPADAPDLGLSAGPGLQPGQPLVWRVCKLPELRRGPAGGNDRRDRGRVGIRTMASGPALAGAGPAARVCALAWAAGPAAGRRPHCRGPVDRRRRRQLIRGLVTNLGCPDPDLSVAYWNIVGAGAGGCWSLQLDALGRPRRRVAAAGCGRAARHAGPDGSGQQSAEAWWRG